MTEKIEKSTLKALKKRGITEAQLTDPNLVISVVAVLGPLRPRNQKHQILQSQRLCISVRKKRCD